MNLPSYVGTPPTCRIRAVRHFVARLFVGFEPHFAIRKRLSGVFFASRRSVYGQLNFQPRIGQFAQDVRQRWGRMTLRVLDLPGQVLQVSPIESPGLLDN